MMIQKNWVNFKKKRYQWITTKVGLLEAKLDSIVSKHA